MLYNLINPVKIFDIISIIIIIMHLNKSWGAKSILLEKFYFEISGTYSLYFHK